MSKKPQVENVTESEVKKITCPQIQRKCVGLNCASALLVGVEQEDETGETENVMTCNNPNVNRNAEMSEFRKKMLEFVATAQSQINYPISAAMKKKAAPKKKATTKKKK